MGQRSKKKKKPRKSRRNSRAEQDSECDQHESAKAGKAPNCEIDMAELLKQFSDDNSNEAEKSHSKNTKKQKTKVQHRKSKQSIGDINPISVSVLAEHSETQLNELVAIDAIYPHSVRVIRRGHLRKLEETQQLKNVRFVDLDEEGDEEYEASVKRILKGSKLEFNNDSENVRLLLRWSCGSRAWQNVQTFVLHFQAAESLSFIEYRVVLSSDINSRNPVFSSEEASPKISPSSSYRDSSADRYRRGRRPLMVKKLTKRLLENQANVAEISVIYPIR